ncbi:MAG TPA: hypothetical protein VHT34_08600 [Clostridia bacterium]|nr:hypothetical protein [Clostridia bacterium]
MTQNMNNFSSKKIALSGMLLALVIIALYLASFLPGKLSLYALSSFLVAVIIIEFNVKAGWIFYIASCLLSLIIPDKLSILPYILFFGIYGIIKMYIEMLRKIIIEYILKLLFFNTFLLAAFLMLQKLDLIPAKLQGMPIWIAAAVLQLVFLLYDYIYTMFIQYYCNRIKKFINF